MYVYIYVYIYILVHIYVHIYIYVCIYIYIYIYICICICIYMYKYNFVSKSLNHLPNSRGVYPYLCHLSSHLVQQTIRTGHGQIIERKSRCGLPRMLPKEPVPGEV